ncbi:hypothetical protein [Neorhizobium sp. JUb45]|uniref:hypothetical protein n=1 Tax=unclassified Neorhizobium TaxID=2629175 RepID=UPI001050E091|nr:hypothetical protein [Neorhizobium sp. JUb45]TCR07326.1 hypothetical protein EDF70_1011300 [Neorhizobium sp. JUb45]
MRTRWDEVEEVEGGAHQFLGFSAVTWSMAVPVAFIAGAAVMSFFDQRRPETAALAIPAPVANENAKNGVVSRSVTETNRWEEEARQAASKAAELQMQVEALRDQVSDESRRRAQAEQAAEQTATALERIRQQPEPAANRVATAVTVSEPAQPSQDALSYAAPTNTSAPGFSSQTQTSARPQSSAASDDSIALQRIIEDTASRSAALSDRRDEMESETTASLSDSRSARAPRSGSDVETALSRATGLDTLTASQRSGLKDELTAGACVTVSLEKVFGNPVPVVPLRNLVRDLDSDC